MDLVEVLVDYVRFVQGGSVHPQHRHLPLGADLKELFALDAHVNLLDLEVYTLLVQHRSLQVSCKWTVASF